MYALHKVRHGLELLREVGMLRRADLKRRLRVWPESAAGDLVLLQALGGALDLVRIGERGYLNHWLLLLEMVNLSSR